jgi:hypothetical protein
MPYIYDVMKKFTFAIFSIFGLFVLYSTGYTQESLELSVDCANVQIDYSDDPTLTRGERIHKMDKSLSKSLDNFKLCNQETKKIETNVANDNSGGAGEATGNSKAENMGEAIASSTISGTELPAAKDDAQEESEDSLALQTINNKNGNYQGSVSTANGKHPDDIPSANNDSALAAQIRRAAVNETDPIKRKLLWDEYRKYKGLTE